MKAGDQRQSEERDREEGSVRSPREMEKKKSDRETRQKDTDRLQGGTEEKHPDAETQRNSRIRKRATELRPGGMRMSWEAGAHKQTQVN